MIVMPNKAVNRTSFWAKIGMTVCLLAASAMLVSGLARGRFAALSGADADVMISANR